MKIAARVALPNTALTFGTCAKISCKFLHKPSELLLEIRKSMKKKCSGKKTLITGESNKSPGTFSNLAERVAQLHKVSVVASPNTATPSGKYSGSHKC